MKLSELPFGEVLRDGEFDWLGLTSEEYEGKRHLTFLTSDKYLDEVNRNKTLSCVITTEELSCKISEKFGIILSDNPKIEFFRLHNNLAKKDFYNKMESQKSVISKKAIIAKTAIIKSKGVIIEDDVEIEDFVVINQNVHIKKGAVIGAGSIIGSRPLEIYKESVGNVPVLSIGRIIIDEYSQIQSNSTVEMGVFSSTYIGKRVCVDDLVQVGHDVKIGDSTIVTAGTIIGGRTKIGENSYLGINCTIKNGLLIGKNTRVSMGAVVSQNVEDDQIVTGNLAIPHNKFIKQFIHTAEQFNTHNILQSPTPAVSL